MTKKLPPKNRNWKEEIKTLKADRFFRTFFRRAPGAERAIEKLVKAGFPADDLDDLVGRAWAVAMEYSRQEESAQARREAIPYATRAAQRFAKRTREFAADLDRMNINFVWRVHRPPGFGHELVTMLRLPRELIDYASRLMRVCEFHLKLPRSRPDNIVLSEVGFCFWVRGQTRGVDWDNFPWSAVASLLKHAVTVESFEQPERPTRTNELRDTLSPGALQKRITRLVEKYPPRRSPPPIS